LKGALEFPDALDELEEAVWEPVWELEGDGETRELEVETGRTLLNGIE